MIGAYERWTGRRVLIDNSMLGLWLDATLAIFPDAQIVSVVRDPQSDAVPEVAGRMLDRMARYRRYSERGFRLSHVDTLERLAAHWADHWTTITALQGRGKTILVRYEELCRHPAQTLRETLHWIGCPNATASLSAATLTRTSRPDERDIVSSALGQVLTSAGYGTDSASYTTPAA